MPTFEQQAAEDVVRLRNSFDGYQSENAMKAEAYDGKRRVRDLGISLPPALSRLDSVLGWPGTVVDVTEERLDFTGWSSAELDGIFEANDLDVKAPTVHIDGLIFGTTFVTVTPGQGDEPEVVISASSPQHMSATRSTRTGLLTEACQFFDAPVQSNELDRCILYRPDETVWLVNDGGWKVEAVDEHRLGRVMAAAFVNRPRASKPNGRSDITPTVLSLTDSALRTLVAAEVAREFYAVPQRYMMGAPESFFLDKEGNPRGAWDAMMGKILAVERDEDGDIPEVGSFTAHHMSPFFEQVRECARQLSAETSIPSTRLGFTTDNPTSADAIRMAENGLIKRAERRQTWFGKAWTEVARLAIMVRDGKSFDQLTNEELSIRPIWRDPATPTRSATTDQALKLHSMGVPFGEFMMHMLGLSQQEKEMLERDQQAGLRNQLMKSIQERRNAPADPQAEALNELRTE